MDEVKQPEHAAAFNAGSEHPSNENNLHQSVSRIDIVHATHTRPYREVNFIGTYAAICLGALAVYGGFVMPATSLELINADIGPSDNITWCVLVWTLCLAVGYTLVGRLSDIFGRRWFFTGCTFLAVIGCVLGATAKSVNQLVGANVFIGLAASAQISFNYQLAELVPVKDRFYVLAGIFICALPFSGFGPYISRLFIVQTAVGWRADYYANLAANGLSLILYILFYHPPKFDELHEHRRSRWQEVKDLDYGGIVLFIAGVLSFLMGISWGGSSYPWSSGHVIGTLVADFVLCVVFVLYECYMPLKRPLVPMHLFLNREFNILMVINVVGGMLYYSLNVVYPEMVAYLYTDDVVRGGLLSCAIGGGVAAGQFGASCLATPGGNVRWKIFFCVAACTAFSGALAAARTEKMGSAFATLAAVCIGGLESLAGVAVTIVLEDQTELGVAVGVYGSLRSIGGAVATAIYTTILSNKIVYNTDHHVVPALVKAGLPLSSVKPFLTALTGGNATAAVEVPGASKAILGVAAAALSDAFYQSFKVVFLVTIAFGGISTIVAFFAPAVEARYSNEVIRRLAGSGAKNENNGKLSEKEEDVEHKERV